MESKGQKVERVYNDYSFHELLLKGILIFASTSGIITEEGFIRKSRLRRLLPKRGLNPRDLGYVLNAHGYLAKIPRKEQKSGLYKLDEKKLATVLDENAKVKQRAEFNTLDKFVEFKHQITLRNGEKSNAKFFEIKSSMDDDYMNFKITVDANIKLLHDEKLLLELKPSTIVLDREFFKKPKVYKLILEKEEIVEEYSMIIKGQLQEVIKKRRAQKQGNHKSDILPQLLRYPLKWSLLKYFTNFVLNAHGDDDVYAQLKKCQNGYTLTPMNYVETLRLLTQVDDLYVNHIVANYSIKAAKIQNSYDVLCIDISELECFPDVIKECDFMHVRALKDLGTPKCKKYRFTIWKIEDDFIYFFPETYSRLDTNQLYFVKFEKDRTSAKMEYLALDLIKKEVIHSLLFPESFMVNPECNFTFTWFNPAIETNIEQQNAVMNIVKGTASPAPYIIFGPPGTGKTSTIAESIAQIYKLKPTAKILVTAPSNTACDEIAIRLLRYIPAEDLYRYYSQSIMRRIKEIPDEILNISNLMMSLTSYFRPPYELLKNYRIILTTFVNSGRLIQQKFKPDYFQYIFFDECGSSTEPASLIPIAGLVASSSTNIVIAGDPKQLGPVIRCNYASRAGLEISMLERLMQMELYQPKDGIYNEKIITKLRQNFRSHPSILEIPNKLFYEDELIPKANPKVTNFALNWSLLPKKEFPIIFHHIDGHMKSEDRSPSLYNEEEINQVFWYVREIVKNGINGVSIPLSEIGVVSPYRLQCLKISHKFKCCGWREIEVGSAEKYQGKEKMVIVVSTVRSNTTRTGFLGNPKRLNVIITRAKGLLIIVGDCTTLQRDPNWAQLIEFYNENDAIKGSGFDFGKFGSTESLNDLTLPEEFERSDI